MSQHRSVASSYFLSKAADDADISPWAAILPPGAQVLCTNLFGDAFVADLGGAVHILDRGGCSVENIATSREEFWHEVQDDPQDWQLRRLANACLAAGKLLGPDQCFAFTVPPILGGEYEVDNIWVAPWREWFSLAANVFEQVKDLPDGAKVRFEVGD